MRRGRNHEDVGLFVSNRSYHKHSMYLIRNSELFGLGKKDLLLAALVALVSGTIVAGLRLGMLRRAPATIDLRNASPTT